VFASCFPLLAYESPAGDQEGLPRFRVGGLGAGSIVGAMRVIRLRFAAAVGEILVNDEDVLPLVTCTEAI
jgi:hypothetical protein